MVSVTDVSVREVLQLLIAAFFILNLGGVQGAYKPQTLTIETNCGSAVDVDKSILPTIKDWSALPDNGSFCQIEIHSFSSCHEGGTIYIQLSVLNLDFPGTQKTPCDNESRVDVIDSDGKTFVSDPHGLCGQIRDVSYTSTSDVLYLRVTSRNKTSIGKLEILATAYNLLVCDTELEFACTNHRCVSEGLSCNGYNDCGDDSDEKDGCWLTTEVIAFIAVGSVTLIVLVAIMSVVAYRRKTSWVLRDGFRWGRF